MALIKCPECGRENVSDSAASCPNCGFEIKLFFDKIKYDKEERIKNENESRLKKEKEQRLQEEYHKVQEAREQEINLKANNITFPIVKPFMNVYILVGLFFSFLVILFLLVQLKIVGDGSNAMDTIIICSLFALIMFFIGINKLKESRRIYDLYKNDAKKYKHEVVISRENEQLQQKLITQMWKDTKQQNKSGGLKCPICGSKNVSKISTVNRVASVTMVGIASNKIGKQYECKNCKHRW